MSGEAAEGDLEMFRRGEGLCQRYAASCLVGATVGLLFVGFVKDLVNWPVDLTVLLFCVLLLLLAIFTSELFVALRASPRTVALLLLYCAYLLLRFLPSGSDVGLQKLLHLIVLGLPVFFAGILIGRDPRSMRNLTKGLMFAGLIAACVICVQSVLSGGALRQGLGTGGYQLTGILIGLGMISAALRRNTVLVSVAALGLALSGNVGGSAFALGICLALWLYRKDFRGALASAVSATVLVVSFGFVFQPPVLFAVVASKLTGMTEGIVAANKISEESRSDLHDEAVLAEISAPASAPAIALQLPQSIDPIAKSNSSAAASKAAALQLPEGFDPNAKTEAASADRIWLYLDALRLWRQSPWVGGGFGALTYLISDYVYPHNILLELLAETGVLGLFVFGAFLAALILSVRRVDDHLAHCAFAAFLFLLSMVGGDVSARLLWFGLGLLFAARFDSSNAPKPHV